MHRLLITGLATLLLTQAHCAPVEPGEEEAEDADEAESGLGSCVDYVGHWTFWGECSEDVPLGSGAAVQSFSAGQVVKVYPSCGGFAGQSVRVEGSAGRTMYGHVNASVSVGQWINPGDIVGLVYGGSGPVYCDASLTSCGVGKTAARSTLCWSGPHLHREGACCGAEEPGDVEPGGVLLQNQYSGRCAEVYAYSKQDGAQAVQWGCLGESNQRWNYHDVGGGFYELHNSHSGKCLEVYGWSSEDGAAVVQWDCHGGANQRWQYVDVGSGYFELRNEHSGKCLEVYGFSTDDKAPLAQWGCVGGDNQRWATVE